MVSDTAKPRSIDPVAPPGSVKPAIAITQTSDPSSAVPPGAASAPALPGPGSLLHDRERYEVLGEHGRGGLGRVSRAHDRALGRDVAIKELISRGPVSEVRFLREALITARLEHPGIVPVHEAGRWPDGTPFYAMKLVAGRSLHALIAERPAVTDRIGLLHHVIAVADAIAYAHGRNIIHRDLKPANVIVGDFGETIVIDWGLAKDLTSSEVSATGDRPPAAHGDDDLTRTGSVLGTPAYMAPEQARGEPVDQRADVFAIGAMLWGLCAVEKMPPARRARDRVLRRAGIDEDLAAIIAKALDDDPAHRYPDAGALAADLKAFKSGARIAARRYSLIAMLAHWARRNRRLAVSAIAAITVVAAGTTAFVRNVTTERDRADLALARAEAAHSAADAAGRATLAAYQDVSLKNAELLLASDPSAAWDVLQGYRGPDQERAELLRAKADGLGVATVRGAVHTDTVYALHPLADGSLLSISEDGRVAVTTLDGTWRVVASNAAIRVPSAFSSARGLLAYACRPEGICLLDPIRRSGHALRTPGFGVPASLDLAPDGERLVARYGERIVLWNLAGPTATAVAHADLPAVRQVSYASARHVIAVADHRVYLVEAATGRVAPPAELDATAVASDGDRIVAGDAHGAIVVLDARSWPRPGRPRAVCAARVTAVVVLPAKQAFAYACQNGEFGIRGIDDDRVVLRQYDGNAVISLASSADGRYAIFGEQHGALRIHDAVTGMITSYKGQIACLSAVTGPTPSFPYVAAGDDDGAIRIWRLPQTVASTIITAGAALYDTLILDDGTVIGLGGEPTMPWWKGGEAGQAPGHAQGGAAVRRSQDPRRFATFGLDGEIALWDATRVAPVRRMRAGMVAGVGFLRDGASLVSAGDDGRLLAWLADRDQPTLVAQFSRPLVGLEIVQDGDVIAAERGGDLWKVSPHAGGVRRLVRSGWGETMVKLTASGDGRWLGAGTSGGEVLAYAAPSWQPIRILQAGARIRAIALSPDASMIAAVSENGFVHLRAVAADAVGGDAHWRRLAMPARDVKFSPDGGLLAITTNDGGVFFYALQHRRWHYIPLPAVDVFRGQFSRDGARYASVDGTGSVTLFDVAQIPDDP